MVWRCPPLHLPNWNNLWKWKTDMNKPVAWMLKTGHGTKILEVKPYCEVDYWIPLYTNPVKVNYEFNSSQVKELTDEEIEECYWGDGYPDNPRHPKDFARAILLKAQEK